MDTNFQYGSARIPSFIQVDAAIRTLNADVQGNALRVDSLAGRVVQLVKVYNGIKPLLTALAALPIIPVAWRSALTLFISTVQAVSDGAAGGVSPDFKMGKDL